MLFEPAADYRGLPPARRTLTRSETLEHDLRKIHNLPRGSQRKAMQDFIADESLEVRATSLEFVRSKPRHAWDDYQRGTDPIVGFSTRWPKEVPYRHSASTSSLAFTKPIRLRSSQPARLPKLAPPPPPPRIIPKASPAPFLWDA